MKTRNKSKLNKTKWKKSTAMPHHRLEDKNDLLKNTKGHIPDVLYTDNGTVFYPCKNCCRAFAQKTDLLKHQVFCFNPVTPVQQSTPTLPLNSVENTMDSNEKTTKSPSASASASELNNNYNEHGVEVLELDFQIDNKSKSTIKTKVEEKTLKVDTIPHGINSFDLKTKAKIVKTLNNSLENNGFTVFVMNNGDIVTKMYATNDYPQLEFITRLTTDKETNVEKVHITLKRSQSDSPDTLPKEMNDLPEIPKLLEKIFGQDELFTRLNQQNEENDVKQASDEILMHIDEEHFPTDDQVMSMAGRDGTIVLEDLDIHICKQCGAVYHTLSDLVLHDKYDHRKIKKKFSLEEVERFGVAFKNSVDNECPICFKKLKGKGSWPRHAQSHSEVGMFQCAVCKKRFTRDDHRKNHESRHVICVD
ncbi:uncharacterized protein [Atheta coriaria]|uniref:uncharacterized protein n=1 Tax=Dalotia coriaria TaxID=877792 RepID=UPI0031F3A77F